jgi:hypothetical protein
MKGIPGVRQERQRPIGRKMLKEMLTVHIVQQILPRPWMSDVTSFV